jgi:uncharacterized protein (TIGR03437 family)
MSAVESTFSPALFMFGPLGGKYAAAVLGGVPNVQYIGPTSLYPGLSVPAKAGDVILLFSTGFGPTTTTVNFGQILGGQFPTANTVTCTIGGLNATVQYAALVASGEYQMNILVPAGLPPGDHLVVLSVGGATTQANAYLTTQ